jgi:lipoyl synthase
MNRSNYIRKPVWIRTPIQNNKSLKDIKNILNTLSLNTVCVEANCPNKMECFSRGTATFLILGKHCTRHCRFCNVTKDNPEKVDPNEGNRIAEAVRKMQLRYLVITSVTRDDLSDGGAEHYKRVMEAVKEQNPEIKIEVLIPDFQGNREALNTVLDAQPDVLNHNVETVPRLYKNIRPEAEYERSLQLLEWAKIAKPDVLTKSGIMVGMGETFEEVTEVLKELKKVRCDLVTIGQYIAPSPHHYSMVEYVHPDVFDAYKNIGKKLGFTGIASGPMVRSSYHADEITQNVNR